jgi:tRNA threonylcarbamoyl adenosine modification protein YjeE
MIFAIIQGLKRSFQAPSVKYLARLDWKMQMSNQNTLIQYNSVIQCNTEEEMEDFGSYVAEFADIGDVFLLSGDLGAGKTTFSRGFIRRKMEDDALKVTSPYGPDRAIHHFDLYRMPTGCDTSVLGIPDVFSKSICLIEWPQRLGTNLPKQYLELKIKISDEQNRSIELIPVGEVWIKKLPRIIKTLLEN